MPVVRCVVVLQRVVVARRTHADAVVVVRVRDVVRERVAVRRVYFDAVIITQCGVIAQVVVVRRGYVNATMPAAV